MARRVRTVEAFALDGHGYFQVRGANGKVLNGSRSRPYANRSAARRAAQTKHPDLPLVSISSEAAAT